MVESKSNQFPNGINLQKTLLGHEDLISEIIWSMDGKKLASSSLDRTIRIWNWDSGSIQTTLTNKGRSGAIQSVALSLDERTIVAGTTTKSLRIWDLKTNKSISRQGHLASINSVAFSSNGQMWASGSTDKTIRVCNSKDGKLRWTFREHTDEVFSVSWMHNGQILASGSGDKTVRLWSIKNGKLVRTFHGHTSAVLSVSFSPDGKVLASGSQDCTIRIWDYKTKRLQHVLEGHTGDVLCISFSSDSRLLASKSTDGTVRLWRCDTWEMVRVINEPTSHRLCSSLAFHPKEPILATLDQDETAVRIWSLNIEAILNTPSEISSVRYTNAKVVLLGNTGVGKSGLSLVLTGKPFETTDSTHGRYVWTFDSQETKTSRGHTEMREVLLWDLAGQPSYRLIHQLHLNEVAVALVVFDARSETDPFAGVYYWNRALNEAQRLQGDAALPLKKFLVAARVDRERIDATTQRIDLLIRELGFEGYFETSAREGWEITELAEAIRQAITWNAIPSVSSTELFQGIKSFLIREKQAKRLLSNIEDLYRAFIQSEPKSPTAENLRAQFETCIGRVESQGLIRRLSFGNLILLQPELLDAYASALVMAAKDEPDGLGCIAEIKARTGNFRMSEDERISDKEQEKLLLIATVEDLLHHEIALREESEDGTYLVFPSQFTRELPNVSDPEGKAVTFEFQGAVQSVYSRLAVRLSHSGLFKKQEMWKNAAIFATHVGGNCGMLLRQIEDGRAELTLFFDNISSEETRFQFEEYICTYLQRQVPSESIKRRRIYVCPKCSTPVTEQQVKKRKELGFDSIRCNVCDTSVSLLDREERLINMGAPINHEVNDDGKGLTATRIAEMDLAADVQRSRDTFASILQGKIATQDFDVFLCYRSEDKQAVKRLGQELKENGILPWLDEWEMRPGIPWQRLLEQQIGQIKSVAVFVGSEGIGPWENNLEIEAFLREFVDRERSVIPVLLSNAPKKPRLPILLKRLSWIDFREQDPNPVEQLLWGITGKRGLSRNGRLLHYDSSESTDIRQIAEIETRKAQIEIYQKHNSDLLNIVKQQVTRPMSSDSNQYINNFYDSIGNVANTNQGEQQAILNNYAPEQKQTLAEAAKEIQNLLNQLSQSYPSSTAAEQMLLATKAVEKIEDNPNLKRRVISALRAGGTTALKELVKHPAITILLAALEGWEKGN